MEILSVHLCQRYIQYSIDYNYSIHYPHKEGWIEIAYSNSAKSIVSWIFLCATEAENMYSANNNNKRFVGLTVMFYLLSMKVVIHGCALSCIHREVGYVVIYLHTHTYTQGT